MGLEVDRGSVASATVTGVLRLARARTPGAMARRHGDPAAGTKGEYSEDNVNRLARPIQPSTREDDDGGHRWCLTAPPGFLDNDIRCRDENHRL